MPHDHISTLSGRLFACRLRPARADAQVQSTTTDLSGSVTKRNLMICALCCSLLRLTRTWSSFRNDKTDTKEMVDIKFQHFEKRRKDNIATVIRERQLIIARLQAAQVKIVVDVRELPLSRKNRFSKSAFCTYDRVTHTIGSGLAIQHCGANAEHHLHKSLPKRANTSGWSSSTTTIRTPWANTSLPWPMRRRWTVSLLVTWSGALKTTPAG